MNKVYIAGPFFNDKQLTVIKIIEEELRQGGIRFFSPRSAGVLKQLGTEERAKQIPAIYKRNIDEIFTCHVMIAVVDGRDEGTMFEIGYATCLKDTRGSRKIITISAEGHGLNIMLRESVDAHLNRFSDVEPCVVSAFDDRLSAGEFMADRGEAW